MFCQCPLEATDRHTLECQVYLPRSTVRIPMFKCLVRPPALPATKPFSCPRRAERDTARVVTCTDMHFKKSISKEPTTPVRTLSPLSHQPLMPHHRKRKANSVPHHHTKCALSPGYAAHMPLFLLCVPMRGTSPPFRYRSVARRKVASLTRITSRKRHRDSRCAAVIA